jgi:hypothetical protein
MLFPESVLPTRYTTPPEVTAIPVAASVPSPPRNFSYTASPSLSYLLRKALSLVPSRISKGSRMPSPMSLDWPAAYTLPAASKPTALPESVSPDPPT